MDPNSGSATNITCSCRHCVELHALFCVLVKHQGYDLFQSSDFLLVGLLGSHVHRHQQSATRDRLLFLCTKQDTSRH